ncbi:MAG TPA: zinc-dependent alcohol dehydrogenase family protein [Kineosporiaceae bacterium]|nr:zinc-dependent alcohol dehydrogenase family protein [Kineosporiaceae bacterium]
MRATVLHAPYDVRLEQAPDPKLEGAGDAVVRVLAGCVCGSDLWPYRGDPPVREPRRMGHEFVGVVEEIGDDVSGVRVGDLVVAPFLWSDGTCEYCVRGLQTSCRHGGGYGGRDRAGRLVDGGQGEAVRVPEADGTLVPVPRSPQDVDARLLASLLTLSDVMGTGHHAALAAGVGQGSTVAVVGDGAVGLCGVLAARRLGASRIVAMSRHASRQEVARRLGATDVVEERGEEGARAVAELLGGIGADCVLECVGSGASMQQALATVRDGGGVGYVGVPHDVELPVRELFRRNVSVGGGVAPARAYLPELLADVLAGRIDPSPVFDVEMPLDDVAEAYRAMHERRAIKVLLRP